MPAVGSPFLLCSPANCMTASRNKPAAPLNNFKAINYVWKLKLKQFPVFVPCIFSSCFISPHWWDHTAWLCPKFTVQWVEQGKKVRAGDSSAFPARGAQTAGSWSSPAHLSPEFKRHSRDYFFWLLHEHHQWMQMLQEEEFLLVSFWQHEIQHLYWGFLHS